MLATLLTVVFAVSLINIYSNNPNQSKSQNVQAADLTISTFDQLKTFANNVGKGTNYAGKTVVLGSNINCSGNKFGVSGIFAGTFDGQGYTISNFSVGGYCYISDSVDTWDEGMAIPVNTDGIALFGQLSATAKVKNLKLYNVTSNGMDVKNQMYVDAAAALCVHALKGAQISNCIVDTFKTSAGKDNRYHNNYFAGIVCWGSPTIENCFVNAISTTLTKYEVLASIGPTEASVYGPTDGRY